MANVKEYMQRTRVDLDINFPYKDMPFYHFTLHHNDIATRAIPLDPRLEERL